MQFLSRQQSLAAGYEGVLDKRPFNAPIGCHCTAQQLCNSPDLAHFFNPDCDMPRHGSRTYSILGGAGLQLFNVISYKSKALIIMFFNPDCGLLGHGSRTYSMHGGAGMQHLNPDCDLP